MVSDSGSAARWLGVAAVSATASSLITYSIFRRYHRARELEEAAATVDLTPQRSAILRTESGYPSVGASMDEQPRPRTDPFDPRPRQE